MRESAAPRAPRRVIAGGGGVDLARREAQRRGGQRQAVELVGVVDHGRVAARAHVGEDGGDGRRRRPRRPRACNSSSVSKCCGEIGVAAVEADGHQSGVLRASALARPGGAEILQARLEAFDARAAPCRRRQSSARRCRPGASTGLKVMASSSSTPSRRIGVEAGDLDVGDAVEMQRGALAHALACAPCSSQAKRFISRAKRWSALA